MPWERGQREARVAPRCPPIRSSSAYRRCNRDRAAGSPKLRVLTVWRGPTLPAGTGGSHRGCARQVGRARGEQRSRAGAPVSGRVPRAGVQLEAHGSGVACHWRRRHGGGDAAARWRRRGIKAAAAGRPVGGGMAASRRRRRRRRHGRDGQRRRHGREAGTEAAGVRRRAVVSLGETRKSPVRVGARRPRLGRVGRPHTTGRARR